LAKTLERRARRGRRANKSTEREACTNYLHKRVVKREHPRD
jgi:hypothetical protein